MREALNYPQPDLQKLETVRKLINYIAETSDHDYTEELRELNDITGKFYEAMEFAEYWSFTDLDTMALKALTAEPPCIHDLTKDEIEEIVRIVRTSLLSGNDSKAEYYMELLHMYLSLTDVLDYFMSEDDEASIVNEIIAAASNSVIALGFWKRDQTF